MQVVVGGDQVVGDLSAGARQLQHGLVRLDPVQSGAGEAAGEAQGAGLIGDEAGGGLGEIQAVELVEPGADLCIAQVVEGDAGLGKPRDVEGQRLG